jgi:hypothetical protein
MNVENRNSLQLNMNNQLPTNRINVLRNIARANQRCCSFCRESGHTITNCHDQRLPDFEILCNIQKTLFENNENPQTYFEQWLAEYYLENTETMRAYAIRYCGSTTRTNIQRNIRGIMIRFYGEDYDVLQPEMGTTPNYIPFPNILTTENLNDMVFSETDFNDIEEHLFQIVLATRMNSQFGLSIPETIAALMDIYYNNNNNDNNDNNIEQINRKFDIASQVVAEEIEDINCDCNICYESLNITKFVKLNCGHEFCKDCLKNSLKSCNMYQSPSCAYCRVPVSLLTYRSHDIQTELSDMFA